MDAIVFEESVNTEVSSSEFVEKQWLYVNDNNNGSYSGQVVLDTTPLSNSGSYINWSEAFMLMPLVLQIEGTDIGAPGAKKLDYLGALKSGYWNMLHSMSVEFNNGNIIQQVPFLNVFCSFKNLTSWSKNDLVDWGSVCGFRPDDALSWAYNDAAPDAAGAVVQTGGTGLANNRNAPYVNIRIIVGANFVSGPTLTSIAAYNQSTPATTYSSDLRSFWNEGMFQRQLDINYNPSYGSSGKSLLMNTANCSQVFRSFCNNTVADVRYYFIDAIIRLKDIADFFHKCPLLKGSTMRIYLNTNQVYYTLRTIGATYTANTGQIAANGAVYLTSAPVVLGGGNTNPTMFPSVDLGQAAEPLVPLAAVGSQEVGDVTVALSIASTQFTGNNIKQLSGPIKQVRLYAPAYTMNPIAEQRYLSLTPTKKIVYNDIFQFSFPNQAINSPFNILVSNGIPNVRSVLVLPLLPRGSNGVAAAAGAAPYDAASVTTSTLLSPFCSTPASPDPIAITNFQIQVSGKNLFINQQQYDFEQFVQQLVSSNQLNGSLTTSLASGLISKRDFQSLYRYYYGNCSRSLPSEEGVAKAIQIQGTISSSLAVGTPPAVDLMVFVEFERTITVDIRSGARIM